MFIRKRKKGKEKSLLKVMTEKTKGREDELRLLINYQVRTVCCNSAYLMVWKKGKEKSLLKVTTEKTTGREDESRLPINNRRGKRHDD